MNLNEQLFVWTWFWFSWAYKWKCGAMHSVLLFKELTGCFQSSCASWHSHNTVGLQFIASQIHVIVYSYGSHDWQTILSIVSFWPLVHLLCRTICSKIFVLLNWIVILPWIYMNGRGECHLKCREVGGGEERISRRFLPQKPSWGS